MNIFEIIGGAVIILVAIFICIAVLLQDSPKGSGISALTGGDSYYGKNQGRSMDARLSFFTKILAVVFFVVTILIYVISAWIAG